MDIYGPNNFGTSLARTDCDPVAIYRGRWEMGKIDTIYSKGFLPSHKNNSSASTWQEKLQ
jgi:hypothetical protein